MIVDAVMRCDLLAKLRRKELEALGWEGPIHPCEPMPLDESRQGRAVARTTRIRQCRFSLQWWYTGVYMEQWECINRPGLLAGGKLGHCSQNHVRFAQVLREDNCISGRRESSEVEVYLNLNFALESRMRPS